MHVIRLIFLLLLVATVPAAERITFAYFVQWGVYQRQYFVKNIDTSGAAARLDVITYAFAKVGNDNKAALVDTYADYDLFHDAAKSVDGIPDTWDAGALRGNFNQLRKLKIKHPHLRVVVSIGGWTLSERFSDMAMTADGRATFAQSCVDVFIKGRFAPGIEHPGIFDGIDIDWEYPGVPGNTNHYRPKDTANFTLLLAAVRAKLDAQGTVDGRRYTLSVALGAGQDKLAKLQLDAIHPHLDWLNLMSYDYHGAWENRANFQAALYGRSDDPDQAQKLWGDQAVQMLLAAGVPSRKINLGVPFYGRGWKDVPPGTNHGLFQSGNGGAIGTYEAGIEDYRVLKNLPDGFAEHRDTTTASYWRYHPTTRLFWTYDDPATITAKRAYVETKDLGGLMVWELSGDDSDGTLMKAVRPSAITPSTRENRAPTLALISDHSTTSGTPVDGIVLTITDDHIAPGALTLGAISGNTALLPQSGVTLSGTGGTRQLRLAPVTGLTGTSAITLTVSDGTLSSSRTFTLTVTSTPTTGTPSTTTPSSGGSSRCGGSALSVMGLILAGGLFLRLRRNGKHAPE